MASGTSATPIVVGRWSFGHGLFVASAAAVAGVIWVSRKFQREAERDGVADRLQDESAPKKVVGKGKAAAKRQQPHVDKARARLEWWQRLNELKPRLTLPEPQLTASGARYEPDMSIESNSIAAAAHRKVVEVAEARLRQGKDWLVRDSDYGVEPAHSAIKAKVNAALVSAIIEATGNALPRWLAEDTRRILLLLDTPRYGTFREVVNAFPQLQYCQQVIVPQADLGHYFEMTRDTEFYPGVRAQRLDHWLCANGHVGFKCIAAFLDYECRLIGALSARLCPAADIMRYFRFGYPAEPVSVLALTVGLEEPAATTDEVDAFVRWEAALNGYVAELQQVWKYRMATLLYVIRRTPVT